MMKKVCIVGFGAIGPAHAKALIGLEHVTLYAICDIDKERAEKGASKYGCKAYYQLEECLNDQAIDSVHICTPHYLHYEMIEKCLQAGKMVVVEKPVTMKAEEFEMLLLKYVDRPVYPIIQNRTNTCIVMLKQIIETDAELGKLNTVKGILTWNRDASYYAAASWRGTKTYEGGGVLINQAVHTLDLMIYLAGNVKSVSATISNKSLKGVIEVEDTVDAILNFENGARGIFYATNAYGQNSKPQLELEFEHASFRYIDGELYKNKELICVDERKFIGKSYWGCGHQSVFNDLYENHKAFTVTDVKNTMYTMFAIYESAMKENERIIIKEH